jgi:chromosome segregation ATPase
MSVNRKSGCWVQKSIGKKDDPPHIIDLGLNSKFCGSVACKNHAKKKRPNPKNREEFVRICDTCEAKYLNKMIMDEFNMKKKVKEEEYNTLVKELESVRSVLKEKHTNYDALANEKRRIEKEYEEKFQANEKQIDDLRLENARLERETALLNEKYEVTNKKLKQIDENHSACQAEYNNL